MDEAAMIAEFERIFGTEGDDVFGPRPEAAVVDAERELGLKFPRSLRVFLKRFGAVYGIRGVTLYGLPDTRDTEEEMPEFLNIIDQTNTIHRSLYGEEPKPRTWINLGCLDGLSFYIDTETRDSEGDSPVLAEAANVPLQPFASSYFEFIRRLVDERNRFADLIYDQTLASKRPDPIDEDRSTPPRAKWPGAEDRQVVWMELEPDPCPPDLPRSAKQFGVDPATRDVFVRAESVGLDILQQADAMEIGAAFFGDPDGRGGIKPLFVSIGYLVERLPDLPDLWIMARVKEVVLDACDSAGGDAS